VGLKPAGPVVTAAVNGGRYKFLDHGRADRSIERLEPFDTVMPKLNGPRFRGAVQHLFARPDGEPPASSALEEALKTDSGTGIRSFIRRSP
jgi:hypothetical protein